ncbi:hypothetical protein [Halobacillus sp. B23F22_1]
MYNPYWRNGHPGSYHYQSTSPSNASGARLFSLITMAWSPAETGAFD